MTNISQQKQVLEDTYNILKKVATCVQHPSTVGIYTTNNKHSIKYFRYNTNPEYKGYFEHSISFEIDVDYKIEDLIKTVLTLHIENIIPKLIKEMDINIDINTIECKFYNNGICASPINKKECHCKNIPTEWCYFKQLARAKEEIDFLQNTINHFAEKLGIEKPNYTTQKDFAEFINNVENSERMTAKEFELLSQLKEELEEIKKEFQIEYLQDNTTGKRTYRSLTLLDVEQERDELKTKVKYLHSFLKNQYNYGSFRPMWGAYLLKHLFNENLGDFFDEEAYKMADTIEKKEKQLSRHEQAFVILEDICRNLLDDEYTRNIATCLLDIINKAKEKQ